MTVPCHHMSTGSIMLWMAGTEIWQIPVLSCMSSVWSSGDDVRQILYRMAVCSAKILVMHAM